MKERAPQEDFHHIEDPALKYVLLANPRTVKPAELRQALQKTFTAVGQDVVNGEVPPQIMERRIETVRDAQTAITEGQIFRGQQCLRKAWGV